MAVAYLGLGSNLGDRIGYIQQAVQFLKDTDKITVLSTSNLYETEPVGIESANWFINAVIKIETSLQPDALLLVCNDIEIRLDRIRTGNSRYESRTIDIDILFYDDKIISTEDLQIPHPRVHERAYVLIPLVEINPDLVHPALGLTVLHIRRTLFEPEEVYLYGKRRVTNE